ncbi:SusF/SusE family outer membrane protein [Zunongwangia endophytica]|uniref:SusF/SusE family outer membrane protein n=1 Tax=Zunongwangia endophytica TaxID=1808945 RepID=A0ABV8H9K7_9FLAO|nr:SusF/SusE family outer membrane protein [Zunongwangia endophytica]MDN3593572.1 SusF/SusE family outer membrane protein [Zunongwangia endophytica]
MKKLRLLFIAFIALLSFTACTEDDDFTFTAKPDPDGINFMNTPAETYTLSAANSNNLAERFVWNEVDFDVQTPVNYELQASTEENFSSYDVLGDITQTNLAVTVGQMLELAEEAGLDNDPETEALNTGNVYFKVRAYVGANAGNVVAQTSEILMVSVTLPEETGDVIELKRELYLVGDATAAGWNNNNNNTPLFRDAENDDLYYFEGRFAGGADVQGFKLLESLGNWQPQWGLNEGVATSSEDLDNDPQAFTVSNDAYYSFTINVADGTYSFDEVDASASATYESIGIIGDSTPAGWDADTDMTQSEFNPHIWYTKDFVFNDGEFKFRANDAWDVSWGIALAAISGETNLGGENITATPGTYSIWFNDLDGRFLLIPQVAE